MTGVTRLIHLLAAEKIKYTSIDKTLSYIPAEFLINSSLSESENSLMVPARKLVLTKEQRQLYASEKLVNFRWICKIAATYSPYILTERDILPENKYEGLAELGMSEISHLLRARVCNLKLYPPRRTIRGAYLQCRARRVPLAELRRAFSTWIPSGRLLRSS